MEPSAELFMILRRKKCALWAVDEAHHPSEKNGKQAAATTTTGEAKALLWLAKRAFFPASTSDEELGKVAVQVLEDMEEVAAALVQLEEGMRRVEKPVLVRVNGYFKGGAVVSMRIRCGTQ